MMNGSALTLATAMALMFSQATALAIAE